MKFYVEITETLQRTIPVCAADKYEAIRLAKSLYGDEKIVLNTDDYVGTSYTLVNKPNDDE